MYSKILSGTAIGIEGMLICVEADTGPGMPGLFLVGYLSSSVREAADRVRTAMKISAFRFHLAGSQSICRPQT